ncbi:GGDEF domain-containing protein [Thaumasiovibrio subtropicus]|uniref:GGDEF domain-containing protein n=1 Tax=Thaumasiovibrio subtropicus TaxID=1891207 RepID=UPI000B34AB63|nr:GGDEF domain-containing protein [Thaumasiovibrio subtropicus]
MAVISSLLMIGADKSAEIEAQSIKVCNMLALVAIPVIAVNLLFQYSIVDMSAQLSFTFWLIVASLFGVTIGFNAICLHDLAKVWVISVFSLYVTFTCLFLYGIETGFCWLLLLAYPIGFLFWPEKNSTLRFSLFCITTLFFALNMVVEAKPLFTLDQSQQYLMNISVFFTSIVIQILASKQFIDGMMRYKSRLEVQANMDSLTGIYNRNFFEDELQTKLREKGTDQYHSLLILDIDYFKEINDNYGHAAGDDALREIVRRVNSAMPTEGLFGRFGGDEFCLFWLSSSSTQAMRVAQHVISAVNLPKETQVRDFHVRVSAGMTTDSKRRNLVRLFNAADNALYFAKRNGRGQLAIEQDGHLDLVKTRLEVVDTPFVSVQ